MNERNALDMQKIKEVLGILLNEKGWGPGELASYSGVSYDTIYKLQNTDRPRVAAETIVKLAAALKVSTDFLLGLTDVRWRPSDRDSSMSPEAEAASRIIDELPEKFRSECLLQVRQVKAHSERNKAIREELDLIERDFGTELRARITKAFGLEAS